MVKVKLSKTLMSNVLVILTVAIVIATLIIVYNRYFRPIERWQYKDVNMVFRRDLRKADEVSVYPDKATIHDNFMNANVKEVTILFKDAGAGENAYYILQEIELINKMTYAYIYLFDAQLPNGGYNSDLIPKFKAMEVSSYENITGSAENPTIVLIHPIYANETTVRTDGYVTYISGETYKDFDLATIKFLMVILDIKLEQKTF